jgi:adenylyl- and sulfurtransferase ThiI
MNFIIDKIQPFKGMSMINIYQKLNIEISNDKNQKVKIINKIMGVDSYSKIPNIKQSIFKIKNIELKNTGKLKEEIGLMNVNLREFIDNIPFDESELYTFLTSYKFLFIV